MDFVYFFCIFSLDKIFYNVIKWRPADYRGRGIFCQYADCTNFAYEFCAKLLVDFFLKCAIIIIESEREVMKNGFNE